MPDISEQQEEATCWPARSRTVPQTIRFFVGRIAGQAAK
jgi:hypothetical protein